MIDRQMHKMTRRNHRVRVSTDGTAGQYILVGHDQVQEVTDLLTRDNQPHYVDSSTDTFAVVELGNGADVDRIQAILDDAP